MVAQSESVESGYDPGLLSLVLKIQVLAFLLYGIGWFFIPETVLESIFNFTELPAPIHSRVFGAAFLAIAFIEYRVDQRLQERLDLVWGFALIPALLFVAFVIEFNNLSEVGFFLWSSLIITAVFALGVAFLRLQVKS